MPLLNENMKDKLYETSQRNFESLIASSSHMLLKRNISIILLCTLYVSCKRLNMIVSFNELIKIFTSISPNYLEETIQTIYLNEKETCNLIQFYN